MEVLKKQNEDLNARFTEAKARNAQKERERAERCEKERRDKRRESGLLILTSKTMKTLSKEEAREDVRKSHPVSLFGRRLKMEDHTGNGHAPRSLFMKALIIRIRKKRSLIDQGLIEIGLTTASLGTTAKK